MVIPVVSAVLFRLGGWGKGDAYLPFYPFTKQGWKIGGNKWFRWGMGIPVGLYGVLVKHSWIPILCIATYFVATNVVAYGEKSIWRKWFGRDGSWLFYGFCLGLASLPLLGLLSLVQAMLSSVSFFVLMKLSNDGIVLKVPEGSKGIVKEWYLDEAYVEVGAGLLGTLLI